MTVVPEKPQARVRLVCGENSREFRVQVANTSSDKELGYMHQRTPVAQGEGMLFVFDPPELVHFWMKDTFIPLEIAYFDELGSMIEILEMRVEANPKQPERVYSSSRPIKYALEAAPGGFAGLRPRDCKIELL